MDSDIADLSRPVVEVLTLFVGAPKEFDEHRSGDVEALGHHHVHLGVQFHPPLEQGSQATADAPRGNEKDRHEDERDERDLPTQDEHDDENDDDEDQVADDVRKEICERLLRADDVIVQSTDERAGLGSREKKAMGISWMWRKTSTRRS
jgi:hypothetical protein